MCACMYVYVCVHVCECVILCKGGSSSASIQIDSSLCCSRTLNVTSSDSAGCADVVPHPGNPSPVDNQHEVSLECSLCGRCLRRMVTNLVCTVKEVRVEVYMLVYYHMGD